LDLAEAALTALGDEVPAEDESLPDLEESRVRELARRLRTPQLPGVAGLEQELADARAAGSASRSAWVVPIAAAALLAGLAGIVLLLTGEVAPGALLLLVAALAGAAGWRAGEGPRRAAARVARAEAALAPYLAASAAAEGDRAAAGAEARAAGLPVEPAALDDLADRLSGAEAARRQAAARAERLATLEARLDASRRAALAAVQERGQPYNPDPAAALDAYRAACRRRAEQAAAAARGEPLRRQVEAQRALERSANAAIEAVATAEGRLRAAARAVEVDGSGLPDEVVERLRGWQRERAERTRANEAAAAEWQRLQALLDGRSLDDLRTAAERAEQDAEALAARTGPVAVPAPEEVPRVEARLAGLREALMVASSEADALHGNLDARRESLPDVAAAEEAVAAARIELDRVLALAATLDRTLGLLRSAEERVHRSLAPVLAAAIARWLPDISGGAYAEVSVDPADLSVRVKEEASGKWREARLLSEGTREQIYLLLRVAMAEHLVTAGETAPLLLDEVTVQSDPERKRQLLSVLHGISADRQVILFTHDDDVVRWAVEEMTGERDAIVRLGKRASAGASADRRAVAIDAAEAVAVGD
ncbi:MAG TPA: hypothetical protein VK838_05855, partial [Candidatus Limnocylindrales bacterium]|nr:hypothetical protein [Candidatus Limnocylindrales bacterium]